MKKQQKVNHLFKMAMEKAMRDSIVATDNNISKFTVVAMTEEQNGLIRVAAKHRMVGKIQSDLYKAFNLSVFNVYINTKTLGINAYWDGSALIIDSFGKPMIDHSDVSYGSFTHKDAMEWMEKNVLPNWNGNEYYEY